MHSIRNRDLETCVEQSFLVGVCPPVSVHDPEECAKIWTDTRTMFPKPDLDLPSHLEIGNAVLINTSSAVADPLHVLQAA